jgi:hypothetical protein
MDDRRRHLFYILMMPLLLVVPGSCAGLSDRVMTPPVIRKYCSVISGGWGPGDESYRICVRQEKAAKAELERMKVPFDIKEYCSDVSQNTGGSYQVLLACISEEMK